MGRRAIGWSPGHLSGYFRMIGGDSPASTGSTGAGVVIRQGVTTVVEPSSAPQVVVSQRYPGGTLSVVATTSPPVEYAMERLGISARVTTETDLPIGAGFGLSAAALLSTLSGLDHLFTLGLGRRGVAALAHEAEIVHRTGLGDVAACQGGGFDCRKGAGIDGEITRIPAEGEEISALTFGPISTPAVLSSADALARVDQAYPGRCPRDIEDFFRISRAFAEESGFLTPRIQKVLSACDRAGIPASMTMLGQGIFARGRGAEEVLAPFGQVLSLQVSGEGFTPGEEEP
jgi:pantoate kinase